MTSDERIEIAKRLRKTRGIMAFVEALGIDLDSDWCWENVSRRVADLIDPTCEVVDVEKEPGGYQGTGLCSKCGELLLPAFVFCPQCGSRVTNGGER